MIKRTMAAAAALAALASGCGESGPKLVPVNGTVTLNGKPLEGAVISFVPDDTNKEGRPGQDITGPQGNYKAMTNSRAGLVPGKYKVKITKAPVAALPSAAADAHKDDPFMAGLSAQPPTGAAASKKKAAETAAIEGEFPAEVPPGGGPLDFDVKAKAGAEAAPSPKA